MFTFLWLKALGHLLEETYLVGNLLDECNNQQCLELGRLNSLCGSMEIVGLLDRNTLFL
jgi:hypothetical protein